MSELPVSREAVREEMREATARFHTLVSAASAADLRRPSAGTRWTNRQLLFHMMFGYMIVRALLPLVRLFARVPKPLSRAFARTLNALVAIVAVTAIGLGGTDVGWFTLDGPSSHHATTQGPGPRQSRSHAVSSASGRRWSAA